MSSKKQTVAFLRRLCCYLKANPGCLAEVSNPGAVSAQSPLLEYYDDTYYYIRPGCFVTPVFTVFCKIIFPLYNIAGENPLFYSLFTNL